MTRFALGSALFISLVGCGSVASDDPDPMDTVDTTPPAISSVIPADGEVGIPADTAIMIAFDEEMDRASVEAAYSSADLPAAAVTMSWNDAGDTLMITPKQPLVLAEGIGNDPSTVAAKSYSLALAASATDAAGNALASPLDVSFTTLKRMETSTVGVAELTRFRTSSGAVSAVGADLLVGDAGALTMRGFVTFDLTVLPGGVEIETAGFGVRQVEVNGNPFGLGALNAVHVTYAAVDAAAWDGPALPMMAPLSTMAGVGPRTADVTAAVADDVAHRVARSNRAQFRLEFPTANDGEGDTDSVKLATSTFAMLIKYLAP